MNKLVRVRFAPSPTGSLHIGGIRTALYNYIFARKNQGDFILRLEDTDQSRFIPGAEEYIYKSLDWLGISPDEGPVKGGGNGPYRQSERKEIYQKYAFRLIETDNAYYAFDSTGELEQMRQGIPGKNAMKPQYNYLTRGSMKNSLNMSDSEVQRRIESGESFVIRLKVPQSEGIRFRDLIRDQIQIYSDSLDDKVLLKSDGMPTYHLANVVDDHLMKISHVIRGEEWLPSAPFHILLYKLLGWEESMPEFAHLPLILKPEGVGKLSKRDGDKYGFPVLPLEWEDPVTGEVSSGFREYGFFPEATLNFLALLGWNPGTERELFDLEALIKEFSLERVNKAGARFDIDKARWINHQYLIQKPAQILGKYLKNDTEKAGLKIDDDKIYRIADAFRERVNLPTEIFGKAQYFFNRPLHYDEKVIQKKWNIRVAKILELYASSLERLHDPFNAESAKRLLSGILEPEGMGLGMIMPVLRIAVTGESSGIDLMLTLEILGKEEVIERIHLAVNVINKQFVK